MPYKDPIKQKQAQKKHYLKNKKQYKDNRKKNIEKCKKWFRLYKSKLSCKKCKCNDARCLDFHHLNPEDKKFTITNGVRYGYAINRIKEEIKKCIVLCANCHMKEHWQFKKQITQKTSVKWLNEYKKQLSCIDCGLKDSFVLCFHHFLDKKNCVTWLAHRGKSIEVILEEIANCEVVCCNCHRIRHNGNIWEKDSLE